MLVGAIGFIVLTFVLLGKVTHPHTPYSTVRILLIGLAAMQGMTYAPWMASYTETVEDIHPSLVATGLAVWGWIIRTIVCVLFLALPHVVAGVSTLVDAPPPQTLKAEGARLVAQKAALETEGAALVAQGGKLKVRAAALAAQAARTKALRLTPTPAELAAAKATQARLVAQGAALKAKAASLKQSGATLQTRGAAFQAQIAHLTHTAAEVPKQWRNWLWICIVGELLFLPLMLLLRGRWSPAAAAADQREHDRAAVLELEELRAQTT
jgi:hypothetical protein